MFSVNVTVRVSDNKRDGEVVQDGCSWRLCPLEGDSSTLKTTWLSNAVFLLRFFSFPPSKTLFSWLNAGFSTPVLIVFDLTITGTPCWFYFTAETPSLCCCRFGFGTFTQLVSNKSFTFHPDSRYKIQKTHHRFLEFYCVASYWVYRDYFRFLLYVYSL